MKLKFDSNLDFQIDAINSIVDLFKGQIKQSLKYTTSIVSNRLTLSDAEILTNLQKIREKNELSVLEKLEFPIIENLEHTYNFTIEMETGTGKTYVYLRTILELNQKYGFTKFIIVVPSVAIKEGVLKTLEITEEHFKKLYNNLPYTYFQYKSKNLIQVKMFAQSANLQIMIITRDAFNKDINIIHNVHDRMGDKPIELIKRTQPIVIMDEPHKMGGKSSLWGISELNPLAILRFSATHKEIYNLIYKLSPYDSYNLGLVKKIEVLSVTGDDDLSNKKIIVEKIMQAKNGLKVKLKVFIKEKGGIKFKSKVFKTGDNLAKKTKNPYYKDNFEIKGIHAGIGYIEFFNGMRIYEGKSSVNDDEIMRIMVNETIREHLGKKRSLNPKSIKVLTLFFINRVDDYLLEDGWLKKMFEIEFKKLVDEKFIEYSDIDVKKIHKGYFSRMRSAKGIERDEEAYNLIMKDKERLLSLDEPVEFIFSHSALREGWDNPNVFNICTLSYSISDIKKRQEIGRGLRLPVNLDGERIQNREINLLTVITNESYREYIDQLQTEFRDENNENLPPIEDGRTKRKLLLKKEFIESEPFENLWKKISKKAKYIINIDKDEFVNKCVREINEIEVEELKIAVQKIRIEEMDNEKLREKFVMNNTKKVKLKNVFNIIKYIENETNLTRNTILEILLKINNLHFIFKNQRNYIEKTSNIIKHKLKESSAYKIEYIEIDEYFDIKMFNNEIKSYDKYIIPLNNNKTLYEIADENKDAIIIDTGPNIEGISRIEREFTEELDRD